MATFVELCVLLTTAFAGGYLVYVLLYPERF